ncbi:hypothetical protein ABZW11_14525 [Nonomuraea sp. NPDC004580]|uniref:hypothetical protein n=1 Tax=Nonomuraea sp. NPDC004580 TaxID=3154552 RepID=UPI0033A22C6A
MDGLSMTEGRRLLLGALAGLALTALLAVVAIAMVRLFPNSRFCGEFLGCLGLLVETLRTGRWVMALLAWPLLHLLGIRPAWPTAVLGLLLLMALWALGRFSFEVCALSGVIAYTVAAWASAPGRFRLWLATALSSLTIWAVMLLLA